MPEIRLERETYANMLQAERNMQSYSPLFDKLEECGLDCQLFRQMQQETLARSAAIKKHFAPRTLPGQD